MAPRNSKKARVDDEEEVETKCTERDVLMGRGKRVSEWPGNIFFRQIVNKYRDDYSKAFRLHKIDIAEKVIQEIVDNGGRFLREANPSQYAPAAEKTIWIVVPTSRCVEKTCQALREKEKAQTSEESPFKGDQVASEILKQHSLRDAEKRKKMLAEQASAKRKVEIVKVLLNPTKSKRLKAGRNRYRESSSSSATASDDTESSSSDESDMDRKVAAKKVSPTRTVLPLKSNRRSTGGSTETQQHQSQQVPNQPRKPISFQLDEMMGRLTAFRELHGHTAVPSNWSTDMVLADWCTAQRQLYREIQVGYRFERTEDADIPKKDGTSEAQSSNENDDTDVISKHQQTSLNKLRAMDFCWNYDEWHWNRRYAELQKNAENDATDVKLWTRDQRQQERTGVLAPERIDKLSSVGVLFY